MTQRKLRLLFELEDRGIISSFPPDEDHWDYQILKPGFLPAELRPDICGSILKCWW